jgi:hypothetical protein
VSDQVNGQVLAYCSQCEIPFPFAKALDGSAAIGLPGQDLYIGLMTLGSDGLHIEGSAATCPRCGNMSSISDSYGVSLGRMRPQPSMYFDGFKLEWMQATNYWKDFLNKHEN